LRQHGGSRLGDDLRLGQADLYPVMQALFLGDEQLIEN